MASRFCSIDASTTSMALAVFEGESLLTYKKISFSGNNIFDKIISATKMLKESLSEINIDYMVLESAVFLNSPKTMSELSMMQGTIMSVLASIGVRKCLFVPPITWQNFIGNKPISKEEKLSIRNQNPGKSDAWYKAYERDLRKKRTINFVNINYDLDLVDNDIADAIGIGYYIINGKKAGD